MINYVIRSGEGFLADTRTLKMVADSKNPDSAVFQAVRYVNRDEAVADVKKLSDLGISAEIQELQIIPVDGESRIL